MMQFSNNPVVRLVTFVNTHFGSYKFTIVLVAFLSLIGALVEGIGINAIIPLFSFITTAGADPTDSISHMTKNAFALFHVQYTFRNIFILIICMFIVKTAVFFVGQYLTLAAQVSYERDRRKDIMRITMESDWAYLSKQKLGHLEQTLIMSVEQGSKFLIHTSSLLLAVGSLVVYSVLAVNISVIITVLTLVFGAIIFYSFKPLFRLNRNNSALTLKEYKNLAHSINENILGLKVIKASVVENKVLQAAIGAFERLRALRLKVGLLASVSTTILQPLPLFFILGIFAVFYKTGGFTLAAFAVVVYAINRVFAAFQSLQSETHTLMTALPYITTAEQYRREAASHKEEARGRKPFSFAHQLECKDLTFAYEGGEPVVSHISFTLPKGELLGLVGPSGAGKTTLVDLLLRLLTPQKGAILVDGVDSSEIHLREWRTNVGYVSQDVFLSNDSIENNIRFYNDTIRTEDIEEAARLANIDEFIRSQPNGYKTIVGERGLKLSGGQRQRIALARVLARHPQILILDEATSALDSESEILIQKAIESLRGKLTVIAIAHRLSTVLGSDRIIALEAGKVVEEGSPQELLKDKESYFSKVYNLKR